jgi:hypothetical protein
VFIASQALRTLTRGRSPSNGIIREKVEFSLFRVEQLSTKRAAELRTDAAIPTLTRTRSATKRKNDEVGLQAEYEQKDESENEKN